MKITAVECYPVEAPVAHPYVNPNGTVYSRRTAFLVRVVTDEGLDGWGDTDGPARTLAAALKEVFEPLLVGQDPTAIRALWGQMRRAARRLGTGLYRLMGAIDIALWDLKGKAVGQSVAELMGGRPGGRFPAVATAIFYNPGDSSPGPRAELASRYAEDGFHGIKVKVGGLSPSEDFSHVAAMREAVGEEVMISVDANLAYRSRTAILAAQRFSELGVYWFEEPIPLEDVAGYRAIGEASSLWTAGGQGLPLAQGFLPLLEAHALHFVQPNIAQVGGFTEALRLIGMAEAMGALYSPTGWGTGLTQAASLQLRAATAPPAQSPFPDLDWIECEVVENPLREGVLQNPIRPKDGYLEVPTGPGLGVQVDMEAVRRFTAS